MKLFTHKNPNRIKKNGRINPHRYWSFLFSGFIIVLTLQLLYFSWYFLRTTKILDAPAVPTLETNAQKITAIEKKLEKIEAAVQDRVGKEEIVIEE